MFIGVRENSQIQHSPGICIVKTKGNIGKQICTYVVSLTGLAVVNGLFAGEGYFQRD